MRILRKIHKKLGSAFKTFKFGKTQPIYIPILFGAYLKGKTILITGGTAGIGLAIAKACLQNGANIIVTGRNQARIDAACANLKNQLNTNTSAVILGFTMDIQNISEIEVQFKKIVENENISQVDILVNNAGILTGRSFGETTEDEYNQVLNTNLRGTFFLSQIFANYLIEHKIKGNILNVLSSSSLRPAISPYTITKWGELGLTKGMAKKLIKHGIVVNAIAPGPTATEMLGQSDSNLTNPLVPAGRYATAEEIANFSVMLISDMGRMIVGDTIYMTGGCGNLTVDDIKY